MSKSLTTKNVAAVALGIGMVLALGFAFATPVKAQSISDLQTQIQALLAQIASLQGGASVSGSACVTFTRNHTQGESGGEIMAIQKFLNTHGAVVATVGAGSPGNETSFFGPATRAAVAKFQAANGISPAAGYWGPITRAKANSMCTPGPVTPGSPSPSPSGPLQGGAGSITSFSEISSLSNEEVGESEEDVEIAGIEIEVDEGSDIELTAVRLDFSTQPSNDDLTDFIDEVSIWLDGEEIARVDAEDFNDDNDWTRTVTLDNGAVIRADETGELIVAVTGVNNIDTDDAGDDWALDFVNVRFEDAQGASVTETTNTDAFTWDVNTFASAADVELSARSDSDTPEGIIGVDASDDTDGVELLRFTLEAEGSDIEIKDLPITVATSSGNTADAVTDIFSSFTLEIDGEEYDESASGSQVTVGSAGATVTFDDVDYTIEDGNEITVIVKGDVNDTESSVFVDGDAVTVSFTASNRNAMDAEDETGEDLDDSDKTGTGNGDEVSFYATGIAVEFVSSSESVTTGNSTNDDLGTFTIKFTVEAINGTVYVADTATATTDTTPTTGATPDGLQYVVTRGGTATTGDVDAQVNYTTSDGASESSSGVIQLDEGDSTEITLTISRTNNTSGDAGLYQASLVGIEWSATDDLGSDAGSLYTFDLEDFETDPISLN